MGKKATVILFVALLNPWIWKIIPENFFLALLLIILSGSLYALILKQKIFFLWLTGILVLSVGFIIFLSAFDRNLFIPSHDEKLRQDNKHLYFSHNLGKLYLNKIGLYFHQNLDLPLYKLQSNLFSNLDPNLYFFASHPRERAGVGEFEKYFLLTLPFFIAGIIVVIQKKLKVLGYYFITVTLIGAFIRPDYIFGPVLFFPLINAVIVLGIVYFLSLFRKI